MQPYKHQVEALEAMRGKTAFALLMSMRTGKTKVILDEWVEKVQAGEAENLLVVAPKGAYRTWETEIAKHVPIEVDVAVWGNTSTIESRRRFHGALKSEKPRALLVNVEALSVVAKAREVCESFLKSGNTVFAVDESTTIKNPDAERTKVVCSLAPLAKWRRILSGLPTPQSPLDLFAQFWFLDPAILRAGNFWSFRARYAVTQKIKVGFRYVTIVVGYRNVEELNQKIAPYSFRRQLKDCYDVPLKDYVRREVELTDEQKRMYRDLKERATTQIESGEHATATEVIVQMLRLHQLCCGHIVDEDGTFHEVPSKRLNALLDLVNECDGKVVIWCSYVHDLKSISGRLEKEFGPQAVSRFWGGNVEEREGESHRFQSDDECRFMVATPAAGGRGRTWSVADTLIYYSNTDNLEHRDQSEERASGIGKEKPVTVIDLIASGTVEEKIVQSLRKKINMAAVITGDDWREWLV